MPPRMTNNQQRSQLTQGTTQAAAISQGTQQRKSNERQQAAALSTQRQLARDQIAAQLQQQDQELAFRREEMAMKRGMQMQEFAEREKDRRLQKGMARLREDAASKRQELALGWEKEKYSTERKDYQEWRKEYQKWRTLDRTDRLRENLWQKQMELFKLTQEQKGREKVNEWMPRLMQNNQQMEQVRQQHESLREQTGRSVPGKLVGYPHNPEDGLGEYLREIVGIKAPEGPWGDIGYLEKLPGEMEKLIKDGKISTGEALHVLEALDAAQDYLMDPATLARMDEKTHNRAMRMIGGVDAEIRRMFRNLDDPKLKFAMGWAVELNEGVSPEYIQKDLSDFAYEQGVQEVEVTRLMLQQMLQQEVDAGLIDQQVGEEINREMQNLGLDPMELNYDTVQQQQETQSESFQTQTPAVMGPQPTQTYPWQQRGQRVQDLWNQTKEAGGYKPWQGLPEMLGR